MIHIQVPTDGNPIETTYAMIAIHPKYNVEMANLDLKVGDAEIEINFKSGQEMVDFCKKHNFEYIDNRPKK